ncbi:MAG: DUF1269 domain-containing protein [Thiogranum sp.]|nr:DUF1269 domain-containing protein [Thiogranum sp.]
MKRLYFLIPDVDIAKRVVDELLLARIPERHIHVVAKDHHMLREHHIPEAGLLQESDVVPAIEKGMAAGGVTGLVAGVVAVTFPPAGLVLGGGAILATTIAGAAFGSVVAPMIGISAPNQRLEQFEEAVEAGELLMILDVPKSDVDKVNELVRTHHPDVDIEGMEPTVPPFP